MKKITFLLIFFLLINFCFVQLLYAKDEFKYYEKFNENTTFIYIDFIPKNVDEFIKLRNKIAVYPEGGVVMLVLAGKIYTENEKEGEKCFTVALARNNLRKHEDGYKGWRPDSGFTWKYKYLKKMPYAPNTYFQGTSRDNGYKLPKGPWKFVVKSNKYSERKNGLRLLIKTSGADMPRPFTVGKNNRGIWKITGNASSFFTGMKKPVQKIDDDL